MANKTIDIRDLDTGFYYNFIGKGENGRCYRLNDREVYKEFNYPSKNFNLITSIKLDSFAFPKLIVTSEDYIIGYVMDYVPGIRLDALPNETKLSNYINAIKRVEYDLAVLSNYKICAFDMNDGNAIYTSDNKIKFIDTDLYSYDKYSRNVNESNLIELSFAIILSLLENKILQYKYDELNKLTKRVLNGKMHPSKYIEGLTKYLDNEINNYGELKSSLKLILK